ncbi:hypothetical protein TSUD_19330 [Trifolium subterraneum]|uniref:RRM domain-containing protein n=1 Tax=Trifolium subterraneum TaxID=3900 RepID=A0A2Z6MHE9_TRISU|nr:hypothetical protein TSUD_19330 [Trifolium subterraneum]
MASILPNPDPGFNVVVTKEEFNLFYSVDRKLFIRLVKSLRRETSQAINIMAFFMWMERKTKDMNLVQRLLHHWPDSMLINLSNESAVVLDCVEFSRFPLDFSPENKLPLIQYILRRNDLTLYFFHERRLEIITEVTKLINDVCIRAFTDIIENMHHGVDKRIFLGRVFGATAAANAAAAASVHVPPHMQMQPQMAYFDPNGVPMVVQTPQFNELGGNYAYNGQQDMNQIMANLSLDDIYAADTGIVTSPDYENKIERPIDDRTLFMTFSKGYPISENELREFFTRQFGDIIEKLIMQETSPTEQSLYARLVVRDEAIDAIDCFLEYRPTMKFTINGKHVWARKFIRKFSSTSEDGTSRVVFP